MATTDRPADFVWGVATSAFQIEGALDRDGRGRSIWDDFQDVPGAIAGGDRADLASSHYDHWREDVALLADLGVDAYRFSIAWPRVFPAGRGGVNAAGLAFYDRLVDELLAAGIEPLATLYHWDLPSALQAEGGWTRRSTGDAFVEYTRTVVGALGDRVTRWITHNEPQVVSLIGNAEGVHAPGIRDIATALQVGHEVLVSHGRAVQAIRELAPHVDVGITLDINAIVPANPDDEAHRRAARLADGQANRWFLDPVAGRGYPGDVAAWYGDANPTILPGDLDVIAEPTDFFGLNYYRRDVVAPTEPGDWLAGRPVDRDVPRTALGWEIHPEGLYDVVRRVCLDYGMDNVLITENGAAFDDEVVAGQVRDDDRIAYLAGHLAEVDRCLADGLPLHGYFLWSFLDNFEWAAGFAKRFGIVRSEPDHYLRVPKASASWYANHIDHWRSRRVSAPR
jgi:beta-glucosidase